MVHAAPWAALSPQEFMMPFAASPGQLIKASLDNPYRMAHTVAATEAGVVAAYGMAWYRTRHQVDSLSLCGTGGQRWCGAAPTVLDVLQQASQSTHYTLWALDLWGQFIARSGTPGAEQVGFGLLALARLVNVGSLIGFALAAQPEGNSNSFNTVGLLGPSGLADKSEPWGTMATFALIPAACYVSTYLLLRGSTSLQRGPERLPQAHTYHIPLMAVAEEDEPAEPTEPAASARARGLQPRV